jgi:hypothetical protein
MKYMSKFYDGSLADIEKKKKPPDHHPDFREI